MGWSLTTIGPDNTALGVLHKAEIKNLILFESSSMYV